MITPMTKKERNAFLFRQKMAGFPIPDEVKKLLEIAEAYEDVCEDQGWFNKPLDNDEA